MIRDRLGIRLAAASALAAALGLSWASAGRADDPPKDEALDRILRQIDDAKPDEEAKGDASRPKGDAKPDEARADAPKAEPAARPSGEVAPKDEAIDSLLEKLGEAEEKPAATGRPKPPPKGDGEGKEGEPPQPGDAARPDSPPKPDALKGRDKATDEHLEELTGRKKKPMRDEDAGVLADSIKQMREVEKRLGQPDTGEETRKKQQEILKKLDLVLEQCKTIRVKSQAKPNQPKPGEKQPEGKSEGSGMEPGKGQPLNTKPQMPKNARNPNRDKNAWGHLTEAERVERDNAFAERPLPGKESLVDRYFLSVSKKSLSGGK